MTERKVSTEMKVFGNSVMTCATVGMTSFSRSHSSFSDTTSAPGRDEYAPISIILAPSLSMALASRAASSGAENRLPVKKESGVIFNIPITQGVDKV